MVAFIYIYIHVLAARKIQSPRLHPCERRGENVEHFLTREDAHFLTRKRGPPLDPRLIFIACTNPNPNQNCIYTHAIGAITTPQGGDMF